jgi:hypothetical protein
MPTVAERLDASLREVTQPLIAQFRELELEIAVKEDELKELRAMRLKLTTIIRQIDPELAPKKVYPAKSKSLVPTSEKVVAEVLGWLTTTLNGDEFYASGLIAREDFDVTSGSQLSKALNVLHERGQIRLVRSGSGGSKHYRVVA